MDDLNKLDLFSSMFLNNYFFTYFKYVFMIIVYDLQYQNIDIQVKYFLKATEDSCSAMY